MLIKIMIDDKVYQVSGVFKPHGLTAREKLLRLMEKDMEFGDELCYTSFNSQKSMDCKRTQKEVHYELADH